MSAAFLPANETEARRKAREIIDASRGSTLVGTVALAYLQGKVDALRELRQPPPSDPKPAKFERHEYDCFCSRCGSRAGSRFASVAPAEGFFQVVCFHCSAGDEPRAA